jgi:signal transduction histidine kinase/CheY-like chemotaxis protein
MPPVNFSGHGRHTCQDLLMAHDGAALPELSLRTLDRLLEGCQVISRDFRYLYVNDSLLRQAHQQREALLGHRMADVFPGIEQTPMFEALRDVMDGGPARQMDNTFTFPDGRVGHFELSIQPVPDGVCILSIDVTARVEAQRLAQRQQRLESLGTLAGGVAHDLNNALAPILMSIGLLRDIGGSDEDLLTSVEDSTTRAARLVRQLLTFSKGSDGPRIPIWPQAVVRDVERFVGQAFPKSIEARYSLAADLPPILGDPTQLGQVLLNLCINARDAMPNGGTLWIDTARTIVDEAYASAVMHGVAGDYVTITVRDTGSGIPADVLDRIFEPFFTTKGPEHGTGLGLSTSLGIVRSHGGFLHVYTQPGVGTSFKVFLPVAESDETPVHDTPVDFPAAGRLALVIDDDERSRQAAATTLSTLGFRVVTANDGSEGLIRLTEHRDDVAVVLLDLHMPALDGRAFHERLDRTHPTLPVIIMSGHLNGDLDGRIGQAPTLQKPFTRAALVRALEAALGRQSR